METEFDGFGARRYVVRAAEGGKKIVQGGFVGQVDDREAEAPLVAVTVEKIVVAHGEIEEVTRLNAWRILVVVLRAGRRNLHVFRSVQRRSTGSKWRTERRELAAAEQTSLNLLVRGETGQIHWSGGIRGERNRASDQAAVVAPVEAEPRSA